MKNNQRIINLIFNEKYAYHISLLLIISLNIYIDFALKHSSITHSVILTTCFIFVYTYLTIISVNIKMPKTFIVGQVVCYIILLLCLFNTLFFFYSFINILSVIITLIGAIGSIITLSISTYKYLTHRKNYNVERFLIIDFISLCSAIYFIL